MSASRGLRFARARISAAYRSSSTTPDFGWRARSAAITPRSRGDALTESASARRTTVCTRAASALCMSPFTFGPSDHASPQKQMPHFGSSRVADSNDRVASAVLKPQASTMPWSK
jgi:hypothetical protein